MTAHLWALLIAAFLASTVEFVEAFTIVLAVGVTINWRSALTGAAAAVVVLAAIVGIFGTAIVRYVPLDDLRVVVGFLLVLFGLKWLKKAILRYAGIKAQHDEEAIYEEQVAAMRARGEEPHQGIDPFGVATSFKSVLLEGLEVAFIVIAFGVQANANQHGASSAQPNGILVAALGALAAGILVVGAGVVAQAPLRRVPENALKYTVGILLTTFGTFWGGEGLGIQWWHEDLFLPVLAVLYFLYTRALVLWLRSYAPKAPVATLLDLSADAANQKEVLR
ncbi:MAG: COG4280 domain-containing protein [Ktedonobacterales bacterium]